MFERGRKAVGLAGEEEGCYGGCCQFHDSSSDELGLA
jgi:hypothetical protein